jgi:hypothetical protein
MWCVTIQCTAAAWDAQGKVFKAIVAKYPAKPLMSKKMHGEDNRIMEFQLEDVSDAEALIDECTALDGFTGEFESL